MKNSVKFTELQRQEYDIEIANSNGFQYAVILKPYKSPNYNSYNPCMPYMSSPVFAIRNDMVVALFSHREYAEIFIGRFGAGSEFYIKPINKGLYTE